MSAAAQICLVFGLILAVLLAMEWARFVAARREGDPASYPAARLARRAASVLFLECALLLLALAGRSGSSLPGLKKDLALLGGALALSLGALFFVLRDLRETREQTARETRLAAKLALQHLNETLGKGRAAEEGGDSLSPRADTRQEEEP